MWRKRLCDRGEYIVANRYCELCAPYTYSLTGTATGDLGHQLTACSTAWSTGHAPGGAVLIAHTENWHGAPEPMVDAGCEDCEPWAANTEDITR